MFSAKKAILTLSISMVLAAIWFAYCVFDAFRPSRWPTADNIANLVTIVGSHEESTLISQAQLERTEPAPASLQQPQNIVDSSLENNAADRNETERVSEYLLARANHADPDVRNINVCDYLHRAGESVRMHNAKEFDRAVADQVNNPQNRNPYVEAEFAAMAIILTLPTLADADKRQAISSGEDLGPQTLESKEESHRKLNLEIEKDAQNIFNLMQQSEQLFKMLAVIKRIPSLANDPATQSLCQRIQTQVNLRQSDQHKQNSIILHDWLTSNGAIEREQ